MKQRLFLVFLIVSSLTQAQYVRLLNDNGKFGLITEDENRRVKISIPAIYDRLGVRVTASGFLASEGNKELYAWEKTWNDTEFIDVPIDPSDPSRVETDTNIIDLKEAVKDRLVMAKKNGKWGLLDLNGNEIHPFDLDSVAEFYNPFWRNNPVFLILFRGTRQSVVNQLGQVILHEEIIERFYPVHDPAYTQSLLNTCFFGDYLIVQKEAKVIDTLVVKKGKVEMVKVKGGKTRKKIIVPDEINKYVYLKGGKYNVFNLQTGAFLFPDWVKGVEVVVTPFDVSEKGMRMNVSSYPSVSQAFIAAPWYQSDRVKLEFVAIP